VQLTAFGVLDRRFGTAVITNGESNSNAVLPTITGVGRVDFEGLPTDRCRDGILPWAFDGICQPNIRRFRVNCGRQYVRIRKHNVAVVFDRDVDLWTLTLIQTTDRQWSGGPLPFAE